MRWLAMKSLLLLVLASSTAEAQIQQIRMGVAATPATPVMRGAELYRDEVNRKLEGRARIEITERGLNVFASIQKGDLDLVVGGTSFLAGNKTPKLALFDLPFFFRHLTEASAMQRTAIGDALNALNADRLVGLAYWNAGMSRLFGSKPVNKIEDLKGLKLRTTVSPHAYSAIMKIGLDGYLRPRLAVAKEEELQREAC